MTRTRSKRERIEFGDWQTPLELARSVGERIARGGRRFASVVEPTCGSGAFLVAARESFPSAQLLGFDVDAQHLVHAREALADHAAELVVADFFATDWERVLDRTHTPLLILGNPPWVTSSALGAMQGSNAPRKENSRGLSGLDALTGKSNFDVSEWMLVHLLEAARGRDFELAMLCKSSVARRVLSTACARGWSLAGELRTIDAARLFGVAVDAVLLRLRPASATDRPDRWPCFESLSADAAVEELGWVEGRLCRDVDAFLATRSLAGGSEREWRSGVKHDCADVFELAMNGDELVNGFGEPVRIEDELLFPFFKGGDLARGLGTPRRKLLVTQRELREDTRMLATRAPAAWSYLESHRERLAERKSRIYQGRPPFAMFGVGAYAFAPYKVAISGLRKALGFTVLRPVDGKPVLVDDTCYFLPCEDRDTAESIAELLNGPRATEFFEARVFWDQKRPVGKALLDALSLAALFRAHGKETPEVLSRSRA